MYLLVAGYQALPQDAYALRNFKAGKVRGQPTRQCSLITASGWLLEAGPYADTSVRLEHR